MREVVRERGTKVASCYFDQSSRKCSNFLVEVEVQIKPTNRDHLREREREREREELESKRESYRDIMRYIDYKRSGSGKNTFFQSSELPSLDFDGI